MGFSKQEYWSGLPFPSPGDLPNPGIEPRSPALQADALTSEPLGKPPECSNYSTIALISHASKVMLKILLSRFQQYVNCELPYVQPGFRKGRGTKRSNCQHPLDHQKSKRVPEKHLLLLYWLCQNLWLYRSQQTVENSSRDGNTRSPYCLLKNLYAGQEATELDMEQKTGSKLGKEYIKAVNCHPAYLTYMQSTSCKMLGWIKHKLESRSWG